MNEHLPTPKRTPIAKQWFAQPGAHLHRVQWALLSNIDGHRNIVELESFARAMGLELTALERLREQGLIEFPVV